ncbi:MAG: glycosyltransferase [Polyangiaceae bacterium]|nr:glycosyltransferase [Polyangiaceae bacterium]
MDERIHVLHFTTMFEVGGTERQHLALLQGMDQTRFAVSVACLRRRGPLLSDVAACGVPVSEFPIHRLYGLHTMGQQLRFAEHLWAQRIDVVHTFGLYANVFALPAARLASRAVAIGSVREQSSLLSPAKRHANRLALALADRVIVNAASVRDELVAGSLRPDRVCLIPNGVDTARYGAATGSTGLRAALGWSPTAPIVAVVTRLAPQKGLEDFIDAAKRLAPTYPEARFLVVGDACTVHAGQVLPGEYRAELERRAAELGLGDRLHFTGRRADIPEILGDAQVSVLPSCSEALSNSLLESMAAGVALVATRVGDHARAVEDGRSGLLVPPHDASALAEAIGRLLDEPELRTRLGAEARRVACERYSMQRMVSDTEALYADLALRVRGRRMAQAA